MSESESIEEYDEEHGCHTYVVDAGHFLFWPCKCGNVYGRHSGDLSMWPEAGKCFDCSCQKFDPTMPFKEWQNSVKAKAIH